MLTRLEVDGFKNLLNFEIDFGPFNCIAGANGVGKSNIFDVIQFLSLLADNTLMEAALYIRGTDPETADLRELFWTDSISRTNSFRIAAEMIVEPEVYDDFGRPSESSSTYLRYEIRIGYEGPTYKGTLGRLVLLSEKLNYIAEKNAPSHLRFPHSAKNFRRAIVKNSRRSPSGYISTEMHESGETEILVHQEKTSSGRPQRAPAASAPRTIVATSNTTSTPTILAARREMQKWRILSLEPSSMRRTDRFHSPQQITPNGEHLPATLYRLATEVNGKDGNSQRVYARVAARLSGLIGVSGVKIDVDEVRQLLALEVEESSGISLPTRSLSDGTLRFLTLCVIAEDPVTRGVICMEEPENGIHPANLVSMAELLRDLVVDPQKPPDDLNPLRQVIVATHSPAFVQLQNPDDLLFAEEVQTKTESGKPAPTLRCRPLNDTWRTRNGERGVDMGTILAYLTAPPNANLRLVFDWDSIS